MTSLFEVRNSFMRRRVAVKSNDLRSDLFNGQTSTLYNRMGRHLVLTVGVVSGGARLFAARQSDQ